MGQMRLTCQKLCKTVVLSEMKKIQMYRQIFHCRLMRLYSILNGNKIWVSIFISLVNFHYTPVLQNKIQKLTYVENLPLFILRKRYYFLKTCL